MSDPGDSIYGRYENRPLDQVFRNTNLGTTHVSDQDIRSISESLSRSGRIKWSKVPRIYVVLHSIGQVQAIDRFIDNGISDTWFPFTQRTLPATFGDQKARGEFLEAQKNVLSEILDFESGTKHYHFSHSSSVPLVKISELGRGYFGFVDRVRSEVSFREYARKLIPRGPNFRKNKAVLKDFENELGNLKKISHIHTVQLRGSYTDPQFVGIIMSPIADCNLKEYMDGRFEPSLLRTFFGCLAVAVRFLHESYVRHKDIKPQNILVYKGRVLLADFGTSLDWSETGHSTTSGPTTKTARYCAPEVANYASRNSSSDIWSLGCTFLEMWTAISGHDVDELIQHLTKTGTESSCYHLNMTAIHSWYRIIWPDALNLDGPLQWIQNMVRMDKMERWTANVIVDRIQMHSEEINVGFVGHCCDTTVGSPETVDTSIEEEGAIEKFGVADNHQMQIDSTTLSDLGFSDIHIKTSSSSHTAVNDATRFSTKAKETGGSIPLIPSRSTQIKRLGTQLEEPAGRRKKQILTSKLRPLPLPNSFLIAQRNRFTADEVIQFLYGSQKQKAQYSRPTRSSCTVGKPFFSYGDCMLPDVVYAETCVQSKPSQYAPWTTLQSLVAHMTPAVLHGYARFCPDASEGLASVPTIVPTESDADEVHGMLIFGWHDSHTTGRRKYESEHEHDEHISVLITLKDGKNMEVEATVRVWNDDERHRLQNYEGQWEPTYLTHGDWYSLMPESVIIEDKKLSESLPSVGDGAIIDYSRSPSREHYQDYGTFSEQSDKLGLGQGDLDLIRNLTPGLFYSGAHYFLLRSMDSHVIDSTLTLGIWPCISRVENKLIRALNTASSTPIIVFLLLSGKRPRRFFTSKPDAPTDGLRGIGVLKHVLNASRAASSEITESFRVQWLVKAHIPTTQFSHLHSKDNVNAINGSLKLISCPDGTELSQYVAAELLNMFRITHGSLFPTLSPSWIKLDGECTVLSNPYSSSTVDVTLQSSFSLESSDGDYALEISPNGKYIAGGCRVIELFELDTRMRLWKFDLPPLVEDEMHSASFSPDSRYLALGGENGKIYVLDATSGQLAGTLLGHEGPIFSLEYTKNGSHIVSGSEDKSVRVWDVSTFRECAHYVLDGGCVSISASPDSTRIFAGTLDGKLASWRDFTDVGTNVSQALVQAHDDSIFGIHCLSNGAGILTGSRDGSIKLWTCRVMEDRSINSGMQLPTREFLGHKDSVYSVNASVDSKIIFSTSGDGSLRLWDSTTGDAVSTILARGLQPFYDISVSAERNIFASAGAQGNLQVWSYTLYK